MIRSLKASDRNEVIKILHSTNMFTPAEVALATEQIDIYLTDSNQFDYSVVVLESENFQVIGFLSFGPAPITEDCYNLYWIAIHPRAQGRGHGKELILWLEKRALLVSVRMILVETSSLPMYAPTRGFYRAAGFREVSRIPDYYKSGDDRITYIKRFMKKETKRHGSLAENPKEVF